MHTRRPDELALPPMISCGARTCVDTGIVTACGGEPIRMAWPDLPVVVFAFASDPGLEDVDVQIGGDDPDELVFTCTNFDQPDGRGTAVPVRIHTDATGSYLLHFRVFLFGRTEDRTLHYTLWHEPTEAVADDPPPDAGGP